MRAWVDHLFRGRRYDASTEYSAVVESMIRMHGRQKAMNLAVGGGGDGDAIGERELMVLDAFGLRDGHYLIDVGCGSGRLTRSVAKLARLRYLGTDVSEPLLDHARATCGRDDFRFALVKKIHIPEDDGVADFVAFFSVGTHLMLKQFFVYLEEARRVLRPGGRIVLSFLDLTTPVARRVFRQMVDETRKHNPVRPINVFFSPVTVRIVARMLDLICIVIVNGKDERWMPSDRLAAVLGHELKARPFGQSIAVLEKPSISAGGNG